MSYQLARLKFSELVYKQIWQANNGGNPAYSWVYVFLFLSLIVRIKLMNSLNGQSLVQR
jgi:hypothetical protein